MGSYQPVSKIAIVGGGPVGVAFAKYLIAEQVFDKIDIFEQRDRVGEYGISHDQRGRSEFRSPDQPRYGHRPDADVVTGQPDSDHTYDECLEFESPLYDYLETNIPKPLMAYSDKPFSDDLPLFPRHEDVLKYLDEYSEDVKHLIRLRHQVTNITLDGSCNQDVWQVDVKDLGSKTTTTDRYDAIVVANGHYTVLSLPQINGLDEWNHSYPGSIIHSKAYRKPKDYSGKKVLVIGNSASGLDIAFQVSQQCKQPVLLSSRSVSAFGTMPASSWRKDVDEVIQFLPSTTHSRAVRLRSGNIEADIDTVIFATGYFYSYPFLQGIRPPTVTDGLRTRDIYQHLFNISHPTLVFPVINLKIIPFPLSENQAAVVARVWSGRLTLPSTNEMRKWENDTVKQKGDGKYFHLKRFPEDAAQINKLFTWAKSARRKRGLENDGHGKLGRGWNERQIWMRSNFPDIKAKYNAKGEERVNIKTLDELGFDFEEWKQTATKQDLEMFEAAKG